MVVVFVHFLHGKRLLLTDFAVRPLLLIRMFELSADLAIVLLAFWNVLEPVTDDMKTCVAEVTVNHHIALVV